MLSFTDQLGRVIHLPSYPRRIISLVPSQTELLFDLGLTEEVVGITKFCVLPHQWFHTKTRVGGTKNLNIDVIRSLQPELIVGNKEENNQEQIEELSNEFPVWISDIDRLETALRMIGSIGDITNKQKQAKLIEKQIIENFSELRSRLHLEQLKYTARPRVAYLIWENPFMTVGGDTFIHAMLQECGFENIFQDCTRYPAINSDDLRKRNCEVLLLSSEPYPFTKKHLEQLRLALPEIRIILVDGQMFSWYGSRLIHMPEYFLSLACHPEV